jgi:hypothetical protein
MLLINTKLAQSPIHELGVFACERIAKGADVWRFVPNFDIERTVAEVTALPTHARVQEICIS